MNGTSNLPRVTLRIPGDWAHPGELLDRLPEGVRLTPDALLLPDGAAFEFNPLPADEAFPQVFRSACRRPPTADEQAVVSRYTVNVALSGTGGSFDAAFSMMRAGAAIVRAGGAGVFIDNSALAHGGSDWICLTDDGSPDAVSFAFTSIVRGRRELYTVGMHVMGLPDVLTRGHDPGEQEETIIEIIRCVCGADQPIGEGKILADERGPRFQVVSASRDELDAKSPLHNPFGRVQIVSLKDIAEQN